MNKVTDGTAQIVEPPTDFTDGLLKFNPGLFNLYEAKNKKKQNKNNQMFNTSLPKPSFQSELQDSHCQRNRQAQTNFRQTPHQDNREEIQIINDFAEVNNTRNKLSTNRPVTH